MTGLRLGVDVWPIPMVVDALAIRVWQIGCVDFEPYARPQGNPGIEAHGCALPGFRFGEGQCRKRSRGKWRLAASQRVCSDVDAAETVRPLINITIAGKQSGLAIGPIEEIVAEVGAGITHPAVFDLMLRV